MFRGVFLTDKDGKTALILAQEADDDQAFVHFSTEDQLERIITKYWANSPHYAVLKIEASKLLGDLVLEANPDGINKYYHLYDGKIPLNVVVEIKKY